jgi:DMSO/TMAO reductase YedYZ molybdopterin-dependent catalytic subunit
MKRKMFLMTLLILALSALGTISFGILLKNSQTKTQNEVTTQEERLLVYGHVQHPLNLTFDEILAMPEEDSETPSGKDIARPLPERILY